MVLLMYTVSCTRYAVSKKKGGLGRKGIHGNLLCMKEKFPKKVQW